jgi:glucose-6-phosphate 1-dehydrogenase
MGAVARFERRLDFGELSVIGHFQNAFTAYSIKVELDSGYFQNIPFYFRGGKRFTEWRYRLRCARSRNVIGLAADPSEDLLGFVAFAN